MSDKSCPVCGPLPRRHYPKGISGQSFDDHRFYVIQRARKLASRLLRAEVETLEAAMLRNRSIEEMRRDIDGIDDRTIMAKELSAIAEALFVEKPESTEQAITDTRSP